MMGHGVLALVKVAAHHDRAVEAAAAADDAAQAEDALADDKVVDDAAVKTRECWMLPPLIFRKGGSAAG